MCEINIQVKNVHSPALWDKTKTTDKLVFISCAQSDLFCQIDLIMFKRFPAIIRDHLALEGDREWDYE